MQFIGSKSCQIEIALQYIGACGLAVTGHGEP